MMTKKIKLSVIIPAFNEENTIEESVRRVFDVDLPINIEKEVIVVDDCSTDRTLENLTKLAEKFSLNILKHKRNQGKGASVIDGIKSSTGDVIVIQDADLEYDPKEYLSLLDPIIRGDADVVYGSRMIGGKPHRVLYFWHSIGNRLLTTFSNMMTNLNLTDMETCYKMFTRKVADDIKNKLKSKRFGIDPKITARVKKYSVYEVGISYKGRTYKEGKKIGWKDGIIVLLSIIRFNLFR